MPVERLQTLRSENPGDMVTAAIEAGEKAGKTLVNVVPLFDEILLVWANPKREQRKTESR